MICRQCRKTTDPRYPLGSRKNHRARCPYRTKTRRRRFNRITLAMVLGSFSLLTGCTTTIAYRLNAGECIVFRSDTLTEVIGQHCTITREWK